jgi:hypothetical protein
VCVGMDLYICEKLMSSVSVTTATRTHFESLCIAAPDTKHENPALLPCVGLPDTRRLFHNQLSVLGLPIHETTTHTRKEIVHLLLAYQIGCLGEVI